MSASVNHDWYNSYRGSNDDSSQVESSMLREQARIYRAAAATGHADHGIVLGVTAAPLAIR